MGKLVVVSGPSGVGKSTVVKQVLERLQGRLVASISATTRSPRPGEVDGVDYYFLSPEEFRPAADSGRFSGISEVFGRGHWYGTLWSAVRPSLAEGKWVLLEIDVAGAEEVMRQYADAITIFLRPAIVEELERRLAVRGRRRPKRRFSGDWRSRGSEIALPIATAIKWSTTTSRGRSTKL